jgi:glutamate synthase domain-containing protein 2
MGPLTNAVLGVLFLGAGLGATALMYYLQGSAARPKSSGESPPATSGGDGEEGGGYLASWSRPADDFEEQMADVHKMAETGQSIIEPMRTRKRTFSWDDLLIKGAQLAKFPLNEEEPVRTQTVIGPAARHPLVIDAPIYVSHMSFGALSREIKIALATGSAAVGTAVCSGEGGILEDEFRAAHKYIFEYVPNQYSVTDENLARVDAIEIKIGQSAKPGMGGHLPGVKVTREIALVRNRQQGVDIISPSRFEEIRTREDLKSKVAWLRERSEGKPIGIKIAAGNIEADLQYALFAEPDFITLDGRAGATGAAPKVVKDATSIPAIFALARARKFLTEQKAENVSLVITGGFRVSSDFAKALALGADAVALATAALMAAGCQQYRICNTGDCPVGITTQAPHLRRRVKIEESARRLENFLRVSIEELKTFARLTGNDDVHKLSASDICTTNSEISNHTEIEHV